MDINYVKKYEPIDGKWFVTREIGSGSYGTVFEICRKDFNVERSALKVISVPEKQSEYVSKKKEYRMDDESISAYFYGCVEEYTKEFALMSKLRGNSNIVSIEDYDVKPKVGEFGWDIFIRMELLSTLDDYFEAHNPSERDIVKLGIDICKALEVCKSFNVIHRDIKPSNIFVSSTGEFKLGDFGVARTIGKTAGSLSKKGTYSYMAPEVYKGQSYKSDVDTYSLGVLLYKYLNNNFGPFYTGITYEEEMDALERRMKGKESMPAPANSNSKLSDIVLKACSYSSFDRFASPTEMREALEKIFDKCSVKPLPIANVKINPERPSGTKGLKYAGGGFTPESTIGDPPPRGDSGKKKPLVAIVASLAVVIIAAVAGFAISNIKDNIDVAVTTEGVSVSDKVDEKESTTEETTTEATTTEEESTEEATGETTEETTTKETLPVQKEWSSYMDKLPSYVNKTDYLVEERTLYKSNRLEKTSSTDKNKDGWELYHEVTGTGDYGAWSSWLTDKATETDTRDVESEVRYRYKTKDTTTSSSSTMSGWELYNTTYSWSNYGGWSNWSTNPVYNSDSRKVETKKQYSYRDISYKTEYTDWSGWSGWGEVRQGTSDLKKEESRQAWGYYYFQCSSCGAHMHGWGINCFTWAGGCGRTTIQEGSWHQTYSPISWNNAGLKNWHGTGKYYTYIDGQLYFKWPEGGQVTQYRYATRSTKQVPVYSNWSSYSDTVYYKSSTREVQERTLYRYCERTKIPTYYFYRWSDWSAWSTDPVSENDNRKVDSTTFYRYRDRAYTTTYYFKRWSGWTDWSTTAVSASDEVKVETKTQYRFKSK